MKSIRVLIVDDEPLARQRIEELVRLQSDVEVAGAAASGRDAVDAIRELAPDLVFLDIGMPGLTGIEVIREVGAESMPATIFVTADDQHALEAFELAALDYLVKPFDDERFEQALVRARHILALEEVSDLRSRLLAVLQNSPALEAKGLQPTATDNAEYLERIAVEGRGKVNIVLVADIDYVLASGPYAELHVGAKKHLIRESMQVLEEKLDPSQFIRIHRSIIVRLSHIETLHRAGGGDYEVQLKGGTRLRVSRSRRETLERKLGVGT